MARRRKDNMSNTEVATVKVEAVPQQHLGSRPKPLP